MLILLGAPHTDTDLTFHHLADLKTYVEKYNIPHTMFKDWGVIQDKIEKVSAPLPCSSHTLGGDANFLLRSQIVSGEIPVDSLRKPKDAPIPGA